MREEWTTWEKLQRIIVRLTENALRKTNLFPLETSEPFEIAYLFQDLSPQRIYVVDKEKGVIDAIRRNAQRYGLSAVINYQTLDIGQSQFEQQGDIVIAYNIVQRTPNRTLSLEHIANSTRVGGLLLVNMDTHLRGFNQIDTELYKRIH